MIRQCRASARALIATFVFASVSAGQAANTASSLDLHVDAGGNGTRTPVVFIHGNGGSSEQWQPQLTELRKGRRAIAYDLRGMGTSAAAGNGDYSLRAAVAVLDSVLRQQQCTKVILVGHSYGAAVAATYAGAHNDIVVGLVLVEPAGRLTIPDASAQQLGAALRSSRDQLVPQLFGPALAPSAVGVREAVFQSIAKSDREAFAATMLGLRELEMPAALSTYRGSRLAIVSSDIEQPASFQHQFPDFPVARVSGAGHWVMLDRPQQISTLLIAFADSVDRRLLREP